MYAHASRAISRGWSDRESVMPLAREVRTMVEAGGPIAVSSKA
jgi:hypothetical protein